MNPDQKVSDAVLLRVENGLTERFESVKDQITQLHMTIDSLEGAWKGIGAGEYNKKQDQINKAMGRIAKELARFQEAIKAARTISGNTEDEVRAALMGVDVVEGYTGGSGATAKSSSLYGF
ncbi:WXG100 family type VII secretion target [Streptomyces sp. cmx-18-6]|uniref:WXG100 family type VII secretion target n=1 Tax=Streptomyces sp. cmx-18-6 TaxID=2790930 RepID=UPI00398016D2